MARWLYDYFVPPGDGVVGGAVVSTFLLVVPAAYAWFRHQRPHIERTRQIHKHLNPDDPFTIGDDE